MTETPSLPLPSVLLSEGFCPIGHGKLDADDPGWCPDCGLIFTMRKDSNWGLGTRIDMTLDYAPTYHMHSFSLRKLDQINLLELELERVHDKLDRFDSACRERECFHGLGESAWRSYD